MVKKFATGIQESWLYNPTTSTELSLFPLILSLCPETLQTFTFQLLLATPSTNSNMERRGTRNGPSTSQDGSSRDNDGMMRVLQGMMQSQQQQTELLRQGLLVAPREQRPGNVSDFRRLQPAIFSGTEKPLDAEQWLVDTTDLLKAARVPNENQVEVAKIQSVSYTHLTLPTIYSV